MSGPRIPLLGAETEASAAEAGVPTYFADVNLYRALLQHPALAKCIADLVVFLWRRASLDDRLRELVIMRTAWLTNCEYEWSHHWGMAQRTGISVAELCAVREWTAADCYGPADRAVLAATDETVTAGAVSDTTWGQLLDHVGTSQQLLELLATISTWRTVSELIRSLNIPLEDGFSRWPPDGHGPRQLPGSRIAAG